MTDAGPNTRAGRKPRKTSPPPRRDRPADPVIEELAARVRSGDASKENLDRIRELLVVATRGDAL